MATNRYLVSQVRSSHRLLSSDGQINDRTILSMLRLSAQLLVKRELSLRKLMATDSIYTTIPCMKMKDVPITDCCEYTDDIKISRSIDKIPTIGESIYQYAIMGVYSLDALGGKAKKLKEVSLNRYINLLKLDIKKNEDYYFITNGYLYITRSGVKNIRMVAYFPYDVPNSLIYDEECSCGKPIDLDNLCKNPLDNDFKCPDYLLEQVVRMTSEKLLSTYFKLPQDKTSDGNDDQTVNKR
jgi:hypothetical protein